MPLNSQLRSHVEAIVRTVMLHAAGEPALVVTDNRCELAQRLTAAYVAAIGAPELSFYDVPPTGAKAALTALAPGSLAILVQSTSFQLPDYRIRVALADAGVKVIAHSNLARLEGAEIDTYIDALAYDATYYRAVGAALKGRIDGASSLTLESGEGAVLSVASRLEPAKLNTGDFSGLRNIASQFPIGEVFTEAADLACVDGRVRIYAFADLAFCVNVPSTPITLHVEGGIVTHADHADAAFTAVLEQIARDDGLVRVRELGFGMNRAFSRTRTVRDVGAFERVCGMHLSLGSKHGVYKKPGIKRNEGRHHVDVFPITERVLLDSELIYAGDRYVL
jgi:aminopeptidase